MSHTSDGINFTLHTPLEEGLFEVASFSGVEKLSHEFSYQFHLWSKDSEIVLEDLLYKVVSLEVKRPGEEPTWISGYVSTFMQTSEASDLTNYRMTVVPWTWFLGQREDCRIFQNLTTMEIAKEVFDGAGFSGFYVDEVQESLSPREFCVQYRESDLNFVRRLLEQEGIFTYFRFADGEVTLVLTDGMGMVSALDESEELPYLLSSQDEDVYEGIRTFSVQKRETPGVVTHRDYDFIKPSSVLETSIEKDGKRELYDYPGKFVERSVGDKYSKVRLESVQVAGSTYVGKTTSRRLVCGMTFSMIDHPREELNEAYLLIEVHRSGQQHDEGVTFTTQFTAIQTETPFRPQITTPKPIIAGLQTAKVVGPDGEEIWLDSYGRVKVQFHWDREGDYTDTASCWVRVAQGVAGTNWGMQFHPRIGQEVIVQFLEGNPDRPVVTGSLFNEEHMPPYELPLKGSQSVIKTRSTPGGEADNYNELRFEDKKDEEHILIHAEKDFLIEVENDESHTVGNNRTVTVEVDELTTVRNNRTSIIEVDEALTVQGNRMHTVEGDEELQIQGSRQDTIETDLTQVIEGTRTLTVSGDSSLTIDGEGSSETGTAMNITAGTALTIEAGTEIVLKCGGASITMGAAGTIEISGLDVKVAGTVGATLESSAQAVISAPLVKLN